MSASLLSRRQGRDCQAGSCFIGRADRVSVRFQCISDGLYPLRKKEAFEKLSNAVESVVMPSSKGEIDTVRRLAPSFGIEPDNTNVVLLKPASAKGI